MEIPKAYYECLNNKSSSMCPRGCCGSQCPDYLIKGIKKEYRYISKRTRYEVLNRQRWACNICGVHLKYSKKHSLGDVVAHIDHIHPFSQWKTYDGDINEPSNLEALCPDCNMKKHSKEGF